jgi:hypothetical protein
MKKIFWFLLFVSCNNVKVDNPAGIYTCRFENEFAKVNDTLLLQKITGNYFKITRHSRIGKKVIREKWTLDFDESKNVFNEVKFGKIIIWDADKQILIFGNREYKKL